jgi:hypothetical protein
MMQELNDFAKEELASIYTSKFKAFKSIFQPPKLRNVTNLNSTHMQVPESFQSV